MVQSETQTPGGVYLCQVDESISCGACCGLYNVADPSFEGLTALLERRTDLFEKTPRDFDSLERFARTVESMENPERPYPEFHHCPYLGLIGEKKSRPGCLLHPLGHGNNGVDHRGLSHWGGMACAGYFCPTCHDLPARYKTLLRGCSGNWHIFGLMATESNALSSFFGLIEARTGALIRPAEALNRPDFIRAVNDFFELKITWPHRPAPFNRLGNYFFKDDLYPRPVLDYQTLGLSVPAVDAILRSLHTACNTRTEAKRAINIIETIIERAAFALSA
ncbi:hypothetical protein JCM14469_32390 [Desulfatiferula olefinivorans]